MHGLSVTSFRPSEVTENPLSIGWRRLRQKCYFRDFVECHRAGETHFGVHSFQNCCAYCGARRPCVFNSLHMFSWKIRNINEIWTSEKGPVSPTLSPPAQPQKIKFEYIRPFWLLGIDKNSNSHSFRSIIAAKWNICTRRWSHMFREGYLSFSGFQEIELASTRVQALPRRCSICLGIFTAC